MEDRADPLGSAPEPLPLVEPQGERSAVLATSAAGSLSGRAGRALSPDPPQARLRAISASGAHR